jgi:hypothetical protein
MDPTLILLPFFSLSNNGTSRWFCTDPDCSYSLKVPSAEGYPNSHEHRIAPVLDQTAAEFVRSRLSGETRRDAFGKLVRRFVGDPEDPAFERKLVALTCSYPVEEGRYFTPSEKPAQKKLPPVIHRFKECMILRTARYRVANAPGDSVVDCPDCQLELDAFRQRLIAIFAGAVLFAFAKADPVGEGILALRRQMNLGPDRGLSEAHYYREFFARVEQRVRSDRKLVEEGKRNERGPEEVPLPDDFLAVVNRAQLRKRQREITMHDVLAPGKKSQWLRVYREESEL